MLWERLHRGGRGGYNIFVSLGRLRLGRFTGADFGGDTDGDAVGRDVGDDDGIGSDGYVVADGDCAKDFGSCSDVGAVANIGRSALAGVTEADCDAVSDDAVIAENSVSADDDAAEVVDTEAAAELGLAWEVDAGEDFGEKLEELINDGEREAQNAAADAVAPVAEAVDDHDPESLTRPLTFVGAPVFA